MNDTAVQLEALYRDHAAALLAYFRRQHALTASAEDLLQDTFVRAFRNFSRVRASISPRAYLFGIARHVSIDALRAKQPTYELLREPAAPLPEIEDPRLDRIRGAIDRLSAPQRETLLLKLDQDLSYQEIAEVLDVPVGTVRSRLHHAVDHLRCALTSNPPAP